MKRYQAINFEYDDVDETGTAIDIIEHPDGEFVKYKDIQHLLAPPWMKTCPECRVDGYVVMPKKLVAGKCPTCKGWKGTINIYYTTEEWKQWHMDNGLPAQEWNGTVYILVNGQYEIWAKVPIWATIGIDYLVLCVYGNVPVPPDDYRHEKEKK